MCGGLERLPRRWRNDAAIEGKRREFPIALEQFSVLPKGTPEQQRDAFDAALKVLLLMTQIHEADRLHRGQSTRDILLEDAPYPNIPNLDGLLEEQRTSSWDEFGSTIKSDDLVGSFSSLLRIFLRLPCRTHEQYGRMINICAELYQIRLAQALTRLAEGDDGPQRQLHIVFTALLGCYAKMCDFAGAQSVFEEIKTKGIKTTIYVYTTLLEAFVKALDLELAYRMKVEKERAYVKNRQPFAEHVKVEQVGILDSTCAIDIYRNLLRDGMRPNNHFLTLMLLLATRIRNVSLGEKILVEMKHYEINIDDHIAGMMTHLYSSNGLVKQAEEFVSNYRNQSGRQPNVHILNSLLSAYTKSGDVLNALRIFEQVQRTCTPTFMTFTMMLSMFLNLDRLSDALEVLSQMRSNGFEPSKYTYNTLLAYYHRKNMYSHFFALLEHMRTASIDGGHYARSMAISLLGRHGKLDELRQLWGQLKESTDVELMEYSNLMRYLLVLEDDRTLKDVVRHLNKSAIFKADTHYATRTFLFAFTRVSDYDSAYHCLEQLYSEAIRPETNLFNIVLQGLCVDGRVMDLPRFRELMVKMNCFPTQTTYVLLIYLASETGNLSEVDSLWTRYRNSGLPLMSEPAKSAMAAYMRNGACEQAINIFRQIEMTHPHLLTESIYSLYVEALLSRGSPVEEAWSVLDDMQARLLPAAVRTFNLFLDYHSRQVDEDSFSRVLRRMQDNDIQPNKYSYALYVRLKVSMNRFDEAEQLVNDLELTDVEVASACRIHLISGLLRQSFSIDDENYQKARRFSSLSKPSASLYQAWIFYYGRIGEVGRAQETFANLKGHGIQPDHNLLDYMSHIGSITRAAAF